MTWTNPTGIKIGMSCKFFNRTYHVIGRAVLSVMDAGRTYYWNEFYLKAEGNEIATLVYEKSGFSGEWRWFTQFDPEATISASEAAAKRQGDYVTIDDNTAQVMLVRESRVCHVEGHAPEGVRAGAHASYFNAKDGTNLFVVSWTGDEVEFYRGTNLRRDSVCFAFKLAWPRLVPGEAKSAYTSVAICIVAFCILLPFFLSIDVRQGPIAPIRLSAPALKIGASGNLRGVDYHIVGHAEVKIEEVGKVMLRHEYLLRDDYGNDALLVYGWNGGDNNWLLFTPLQAALAPTPREAGHIKLGQKMLVGDVSVTVKELFRSTVLQSDGATRPDSSMVHFGLVGQTGGNYLIAQWNEQAIAFDEGKLVSDRDVTAAFGSQK